jgi:hypothetical protein
VPTTVGVGCNEVDNLKSREGGEEHKNVSAKEREEYIEKMARKRNKKQDVETKEKEAEIHEKLKEQETGEEDEESKDEESKVEEDDTSVCEVESVLKMKRTKDKSGKTVSQFLVKWKGYNKSHNSWEPKSYLIGEACEYHQEILPQQPITCQISH